MCVTYHIPEWTELMSVHGTKTTINGIYCQTSGAIKPNSQNNLIKILLIPIMALENTLKKMKPKRWF